MKRLAWRGEPGKGRQRIGSRGKLAAGNSRLDSTRFNSPFFFFWFFLSSALTATLFSVSRERTACTLVYRRTTQAPPRRSSCTHRRVYTGWCLFARCTASRTFHSRSSDHRSREISSIFCSSRGIFHLRENRTYENRKTRFVRFSFSDVTRVNFDLFFLPNCREMHRDKFKVNLLFLTN